MCISVKLYFISYLLNLVFSYNDIVTYVLIKQIYMIVDYLKIFFLLFSLAVDKKINF